MRLQPLGGLGRIVGAGAVEGRRQGLDRGVGVEGVAFRLETAGTELLHHRLAVGDQPRVGAEGHQHALDVLRTAGGGRQFVGDHAVVGHEPGGQSLFAHLPYQRTGFRMQAAEVDDLGTGGADLGDQRVEVLLAAGQALVENLFHAELVQLRPGGVRQALAVGVLVMDHRDLLGLEHVDDIVAGDHALLVVAAAHAEHPGESALGDLRVGGTGGDGDDPGLVVDLGCGDGRRRAEMADHGDGLVLVHQAVGHGHGLLRFAGVVGLDQLDLLAVDPTRRVDVFRRLGRAAPVLLAEGGVGAGMRSGHADHDVGQRMRGKTHHG